MKSEINWWELDDNEILLINKDYCDFILGEIKSKYKNLNKFRFELNIGREIYQNLKYKTQGISNNQLRKILCKLKIDFSQMNNNFKGVGRFKTANLIFPVNISPLWSCLLAHAFFDGYADRYIMRYSNYDKDNRNEFATLIRKLFNEKLAFNNPTNFERDIDLPAIVPRLLNKFFDVQTFYSSKCRMPKYILQLTKNDKNYGFYFLKGAYIDEGSISGGQIWIVRGIKNKSLAKDIVKLCKMLDISCRLKFSNKNLGGYSVGVKKDSFDYFYDNLSRLFWNPNKKLLKLEDMILRHRNPLERDLFGRFMKREIYAR